MQISLVRPRPLKERSGAVIVIRPRSLFRNPLVLADDMANGMANGIPNVMESSRERAGSRKPNWQMERCLDPRAHRFHSLCSAIALQSFSAIDLESHNPKRHGHMRRHLSAPFSNNPSDI
jgi:hypothetical protein